jgi:hypothetical protein
MPGGTVGDERVPPLGAPALGNAVPFEDHMLDAGFGQVFAHGEASLTAADNDRIYLLDRQFCVPV